MQKSIKYELGKEKQMRYILIFLCFCGFFLPKNLWSSNITNVDSIKITAISTGKTTGHIADLYISHTASEAQKYYLPPSFIPSQGGYQSYLTLTDTSIILEPLIETRIALRGYCADLFVDPVPQTRNLPDFSEWVQINTQATKEHFNPDLQKWIKDSHSRILNPINLRPLKLAIDFEKHPEEIAWFLWSTLTNLESAYDSLSSQKLINTPYSQDKTQERNGIVQHSFWIITSELNGKYYLKEHFEAALKKQYSTTSLSSEENDQIRKGISQLWTTFHLLLDQTRVMDIYKLNSRFVREFDEEILLMKEGN